MSEKGDGEKYREQELSSGPGRSRGRSTSILKVIPAAVGRASKISNGRVIGEPLGEEEGGRCLYLPFLHHLSLSSYFFLLPPINDTHTALSIILMVPSCTFARMSRGKKGGEKYGLLCNGPLVEELLGMYLVKIDSRNACFRCWWMEFITDIENVYLLFVARY